MASESESSPTLQALESGVPLELERLNVLHTYRTLTVRVLIDPADVGAFKDRFTLRAEGMGHRLCQTLRLSAEGISSDAWVDLPFQGLFPGLTYRLEIDDEEGAPPQTVFQALSFEALFGDGPPPGEAPASEASSFWGLTTDDGGPGIVPLRPPLRVEIVSLEAPHFAPKAETLRVEFSVSGASPDRLAGLTFKVVSKAEPSTVLLERSLDPSDPFTLLWDGETTAGASAKGVTLKGSPYLLSIEAQAIDGRWATSPTRTVAVKAHSLYVRISDHASLGLSPRDAAVVKLLIAQMGASASGEVIFPSPLFKVSNAEMNDSTAFRTYRDAWGDGIPLPLIARVHVLGKGGDAHRCEGALAGARILWDLSLEDDAALNRRLGGRRLHAQALAFQRKVFAHKATTSTPPGTSAHDDVGGMRGRSGSRWSQAKSPWPVSPPGTRTWAGYSECAHDGPVDGDSGIAFQTGRIAGDVHRVTAYLDLDGALDTRDAAVLAAAPAAHVSRTLSLENRRRLEVVANLQVGTSGAALSLPALEREYGKAAWDLVPSAGLTLTDIKAQWTRLYAAKVRALAPTDDFIRLAAYEDPQGWPTRFIDHPAYERALAADASLSARRKAFLSIPTLARYIDQCNLTARRLYDGIARQLPLAKGGLTLIKFHKNGHHNQHVSSFTAGVAPSLPGHTSRTRSLLFVFKAGPATDTLLHEVGHLVFLAHAPGHFNAGEQPPGYQRGAHDASDVCTMSYARTKNGICGLCLLKLEGWDSARVSKDGVVS